MLSIYNLRFHDKMESSAASTTDPTTPSTATSLAGYYEHESFDNVDEYLKGLGVGLVLRKVQTVSNPRYDITQLPSSNQWKITVASPFKRREIVFRHLEKFQDVTFDGRECQTTADLQNNGTLMTMTQLCTEGPEVLSLYTATSTGFTLSMKCGDFRCEQKFRRAERSNLVAPPPHLPNAHVALGTAAEIAARIAVQQAAIEVEEDDEGGEW